MKRYFSNIFTAIISIAYILNNFPIFVYAFLSNNLTYVYQELIFIIPYIIGSFIISVLLIYTSFKNPVKSDESLKSFIISFLGTNLYTILSYFINFKNPTPNNNVLYIAVIMQFLIQGFYLIALITLGKNLTVLPEARELKTTGVYSISRHPLYFSYILINILSVFINQSLIFIPVMLLCNYLQYKRALAEEKILIEVFPEYINYKATTMFFGKRKWIDFIGKNNN